MLLAYYNVTFGKGARAAQGVAAAFADATFDEYLALCRIQYPGMSRHDAAKRAPRADLRALAASFAEEQPPDEPEEKVFDASGAGVDLAKLKVPPGAGTVVLKGAKTLSGFETLARIKHIRCLWVRSCRAAFPPPGVRVAVDEIDAGDCRPEFMRSVLQATSVRSIAWIDWGKAPIDLAPLAKHPHLARVRVAGPLVRNVLALRGHELDELALSRVRTDESLRVVLAGAGRSLRRIDLTSSDDIAPSDLPFGEMTALERVTLRVHPTHREQWIALAVAHPTVRFEFDAPPSPLPKLPDVQVVETYREVEILRSTKGNSTRFRVESDLAAAVDYTEGNGELEDALAPLAKQANKKIAWGSEADTLVATCRDIETIRWVIDAAHLLAADPSVRRHPR